MAALYRIHLKVVLTPDVKDCKASASYASQLTD